MRIATTLIMLAMTLPVRLAGEEATASNTSNSFSPAENRVKTALEKFAAAAAPINLLSLDISFAEGRDLNEYRNWAARSPEDASEILRALHESRASNLWSRFKFFTVLTQREGHCSGLVEGLRRYALTPADTTERNRMRESAYTWSVNVQKACMELHEARLDYETEFASRLGEADRLLKACPP